MPFEEPVGKMLFWPKKRPKDSEFRETNDDKIGGFLFSLSSIFFPSLALAVVMMRGEKTFRINFGNGTVISY